MNYNNSNKKVKTAESAMMEKSPPNFDPALEKKLLKQYASEPAKAYATMWDIHNKKNESTNGIRVAKEGIEECWDDMGGQTMTQENGEQMSVTISMPGKNISVTTDSADEIGNILRLAGINVGGMSQEVPGDVDGDGDHDIHDHEAEIMYVGTGAESEPSVPAQPAEEPEEEEEQTQEATQTPKPWTDSEGNEHPGTAVKGDKYGNQEEKEKEVEEATKTDKPWTDMNGEEHPGTAVKGDKYGNQEEEKEVDESTRILQLAGLGEAKKPDADNDGVPDWADEHPGEDDNEVKESTEAEEDDEDYSLPMPNGEYDEVEESARILALAGLGESKLMNSPAGTSMDEPKVYDSLPSRSGTGKGSPDFGANRANGQGENPMGDGTHTVTVEEQFKRAMGEYRKFVAENIARKK